MLLYTLRLCEKAIELENYGRVDDIIAWFEEESINHMIQTWVMNAKQGWVR